MSLAATNAVWSTSRQSGTHKLVLLAIADRADETGCAWPGARELSSRAGVTERQVRRIVSRLVASGELEVIASGGGDRSNRYRITLPTPDTYVTGTPDMSVPTPDVHVTGTPDMYVIPTPDVEDTPTPDISVTAPLTPVSDTPDTSVTRTISNHHRTVKLSKEIEEIYEHWRDRRGKTRASYETISPARRKKIETRLKDGYTVADLKTAIDNVALDPWPERARQDDLTIIFRSREQVDKFLDLAEPYPYDDDLPLGGLRHLTPADRGLEWSEEHGEWRNPWEM